jgi:hypothetical protein
MLAFSLIARLDRWWLQRVPMLWRTRLVTALLALIVFTFLSLLIFPHAVTGFGSPHELDIPNIRNSWELPVLGAVIALGLWVLMILRRPVGELPLRRHVVTLIAVAVGSYLWLVTPSVLSLREIRAIANLASPEELDRDLSVLGLYSNWTCVPAGEGDAELEQLKKINERFDPRYNSLRLEKGEINYLRCPKSDVSSYSHVNYFFVISDVRDKINVIQDARHFWSDDAASNRFSGIRASFSGFVWAALGIGILTTLLSYPAYVWRRTLLHR